MGKQLQQSRAVEITSPRRRIPEDFHGIPLDHAANRGRYLTPNERLHIQQSTPDTSISWEGFKLIKSIPDRLLPFLRLLGHTMEKLAGESRDNEFKKKPAPQRRRPPVNTWDFRLEDTYFCLNCGSGYALPRNHKGE